MTVPCHMYEACQKKTHFYEKRPIKKSCSLIRMSFVRVRCYMCGTYVWHRWCYFTNTMTATPHVVQEMTYFCERRSIKEECWLMHMSCMCVTRYLCDTYAWHRWCYFICVTHMRDTGGVISSTPWWTRLIRKRRHGSRNLRCTCISFCRHCRIVAKTHLFIG